MEQRVQELRRDAGFTTAPTEASRGSSSVGAAGMTRDGRGDEASKYDGALHVRDEGISLTNPHTAATAGEAEPGQTSPARGPAGAAVGGFASLLTRSLSVRKMATESHGSGAGDGPTAARGGPGAAGGGATEVTSVHAATPSASSSQASTSPTASSDSLLSVAAHPPRAGGARVTARPPSVAPLHAVLEEEEGAEAGSDGSRDGAAESGASRALLPFSDYRSVTEGTAVQVGQLVLQRVTDGPYAHSGLIRLHGVGAIAAAGNEHIVKEGAGKAARSQRRGQQPCLTGAGSLVEAGSAEMLQRAPADLHAQWRETDADLEHARAQLDRAVRCARTLATQSIVAAVGLLVLALPISHEGLQRGVVIAAYLAVAVVGWSLGSIAAAARSSCLLVLYEGSRQASVMLGLRSTDVAEGCGACCMRASTRPRRSD